MTELSEAHGPQAWTHLHHALRSEVDLSERRRTLFRDTVWTRIEWSRAIGRPDAAELRDGFDVRMAYLIIDGAVGPDGRPINKSRWIDAIAPALWDGPHDDDVYRVSVMARGQSPWLNWLGVSLRSRVSWSGIDGPAWLRRSRRVVYPAGLADRNGVLQLDADGITAVGDFRVVPW